VVDDPTIKQRGVAARGGALYRPQAVRRRRESRRRGSTSSPRRPNAGGKFGASRARKPTLDEMGPGTESRIYSRGMT